MTGSWGYIAALTVCAVEAAIILFVVYRIMKEGR
jgi:hypothetical protein